MADNIQFRVDAVLGDTSQLQQQINNLRTNLNLTINNSQALRSIQAVQQQVDALRRSANGINLGGISGGNGVNLNGLNSGVNSAQRLQQIMQNVGLQMGRIRTVNGEWQSVTERIGDRYSNIERTLTANNRLTETTTHNHQRLQSDIDAFHKKNLNGIDFEIQRRETASQKFSQQLKAQMEMQTQQQNALNKLGMDTGNSLNTNTIRDVESLKSALSSANIGWDNNSMSIKQFSQQVDNAGNTITKFTTRHKTVENGVEVWKDTSYAVSSADGQLRQYNQTQQQVLNTQQSLSTMLKSALERFLVWGVAMKVWTTIGNSINDCIGYVQNLDSAMTNIRVVTMDTKEATEGLLKTYNQLGQSLGADTLDIAEGAVDWLRQGYSEADTTELVKDSTILSRLALIDNAEATEYLTSALKGYKLEAQDAIGVIDQLVSIDLECATSSADLAEAMSRTANLARTTGFEMNELLGVIGTVSETTQMSASTVGNSMKTLLSRMSNVKAGVEIDPESGEALNDVEKVLNRVGIALRDNQDNWYDFYDVLDEIANRWDEFSEIQQSQITTALGGTRQRENVLVMLENWDKVKQYAETGANASGTAMEKYGIVLESVEAKQAQLTAKVQEFYQSILNSGLIAGLLDIGKALMDIMNIGNGTVGKILLLVTALTALSLVAKADAFSNFRKMLLEIGTSIKTVIIAIPQWIAGLRGAKTAQDAVNTSTATGNALAMANPWLAIAEIVILAIMGIKLAIDKANQAIQESIDKANELTEAYNSSTQEIQDGINSLTSGSGGYSTLAEEFEALCKGVDAYGNNISLTSEQYERYKSICQQIVGLNPSLLQGYDSETEAIGNKNSLLQDTIDLLKEEQRLKAQEYADSSNDVFEGAKNKYEKDIKEFQKTKEGIEATLAGHDYSRADLNTNYDDSDSYFKNTFGYLFDYSETDVQDIYDNYDRYIKGVEEARKYLQDKIDSGDLSFSQQNLASNMLGTLNTQIEPALKYLGTAKDEYGKAIDGVNSVTNEFADSMNTIYKATAQGTEGYFDLSGGSKSFIEDFYDNNFNVDENTTAEMIENNKRAIQEIVKSLSDNKEAQNALDKFYKLDTKSIKPSEYRKQYEEIVKQIAEASGQEESKVKLAIKFDADVAKAEKEIKALTDALANTKGFNNKKGKIADYLEGLSTEELERARLVLQRFTDDAGNLNTAIIGSIDELDAYVQKFVNVDNALNEMANGFASATQARNAFEANMDGIVEYDTNFNSYTEAVKTLKEEFDKGTVGSKTFATACRYLFGESFDVTDVDSAYEKLKKMETLFAEDSYGEGMLKQLSKIKSEFWDIKQNADGTWDFDLDTSQEGIEAMAKALGTTEEGVWSLLEAMQMYGDVDLFDTDTIKDFASSFGLLQDLDIEGIEKQAVAVDKLKEQLEEAGINTEYLGDALKQMEKDGVVTLDISADISDTIADFEALGLVIKDAEGNMTANIDELIASLGSMGYSSEQIASVLEQLKAVDNFSFTTTSDGKQVKISTEEADGKIQALKDKQDGVNDAVNMLNQIDLTSFQTTIGSATAVVQGLNDKLSNSKTYLEEICKPRSVIITYTEIGKPKGTGGLHGIGNGIPHKGRTYFKGTAYNYGNLGAKTDVNALTGEIEPEIWVHADTGEWELITNPRFVRVKKGDIIFNGQQTRDLLGRGYSANFGRSFLKGTAFASSTSWGQWKKKYATGSSSSSSGSSSSQSSYSSKSSSGNKEWWEDRLEELKDNLDYNTITMDAYIEGLEVVLGQLKKGTEAWNEVNKELLDAKLDNIENQFDRGEITIDEYISKIEELRNSYKKNSEGYKELTQTINEAKADKYADEYERGQISLATYIKQLTTLRNSYKKNSEEWKKYNDLINDSKLEETEKWIEELQEKVDDIEDRINQLGDVNTDKESVEYAELLSEKYAQVQSNIVKIKEALKDANLTEEQRNALQEELNDLLEEEVDIRDEIEDSVRDYFESQKEQLEQEAELNKKKTLYNKEVELYGKQGKELYEYYTNKEIEALEAKRDALDENNEREELENNLLEARLKLQNALNNKTTKILKKQADGTWQYEYSANMVEVKSAQEEIADAEKALAEYDIQEEIDKLNDNLEDLSGQYEDAEFWAERQYEQTINGIGEAFGDIDKLVEDWMALYDKDSTTLTNAYTKLTQSNNNLQNSLTALAIAIESNYETVGSKDVKVKAFNTGGVVSGDGLAWVDDKERVLTDGQNAYFEQFIAKLPQLLKAVDVTKFNGYAKQINTIKSSNGDSSSTVISKVECVFPNITTTDGLQRAILELPRLALQKK
jgi:TP901 family phage tail tape measure protein